MIIKLNRSKILVTFIAVIALYFVLYNYNQLKNSETAEGIVAEKYILSNYDNTKGVKTYLDNTKVYNIIVYKSATNNKIEATALYSEETFEKGSNITIRYYPQQNKKEIIYTFWSFWFTSIIVCCIAIVVVLAFAFSFIDENEIILLHIGKGGVSLTKNSNKVQTKTDLTKLNNKF